MGGGQKSILINKILINNTKVYTILSYKCYYTTIYLNINKQVFNKYLFVWNTIGQNLHQVYKCEFRENDYKRQFHTFTIYWRFYEWVSYDVLGKIVCNIF